MAYESTTVTVERSQSEINRLLYNHGCEATRFTNTPDGAIIDFIRLEVKDGRERRIAVSLPVRYRLSEKMTQKQMQQHIRTKWRSVFYWLKAQFDAMDQGIIAYEEAFMPNLIVALPNGTSGRLRELMPQLSNGQHKEIRFALEAPKEEIY